MKAGEYFHVFSIREKFLEKTKISNKKKKLINWISAAKFIQNRTTEELHLGKFLGKLAQQFMVKLE